MVGHSWRAGSLDVLLTTSGAEAVEGRDLPSSAQHADLPRAVTRPGGRSSGWAAAGPRPIPPSTRRPAAGAQQVERSDDVDRGHRCYANPLDGLGAGVGDVLHDVPPGCEVGAGGRAVRG